MTTTTETTPPPIPRPAASSPPPTDPSARHAAPATVSASRPSWAPRLLTGLLPVVILAAAALGVWWLLNTSPRQSTAPVEPLIPTVEVISAAPQTVPVKVGGFGTVEPALDAALSPEIEARVVEVGPAVQPGGLVREGDLLLRLDPAEYELAVAAARADLAGVEADLEMERGRGRVAAQQWEQFADTLGDAAQDERSAALANREPQLRQVEARMLQAQNAIARAELDLSRTELRAPFDAVVLSESVEIGRRVSPGDELMRLAGTATFWIEAVVSPRQAGRLTADASATVTTDAGERQGRLVRVLPEVDRRGRMARLLIAVDDPLGLAEAAPSLPIGAYVSVDLEGGTVEKVVAVPRAAVRENGQVWVRDAEGLLQFREVATAWTGAGDALLDAAAFEPDDAVITSYLNNPLPGTPVRLREQP